MIRWKSWSLSLPVPVPVPVPLPILLLLLLISLIATSIHAAETETYTDIQSHAETLMEGQAEAQAAAEASTYSQAPSIEGRLYHNYLETSASSSSSSSSYNEDDAYAQGQAEMQAWINDIKQEIASARTNNIVDASFLESDNAGETFSSAQSGVALSATIEQQMNEQLDGEIHGMTQQEIEQQAQIVEMLAADAADAAEMGEQDPSDSQFVETNADVDQQHHMDVHESLRESMNTDAGMEALHELAMDKAREAAVKRAETWLQDGLDTSDTSAIETDSHTNTNIDTELDMILGADATAEQLAAQEARIWESMDAESKMVARASMAIDTLLTHTAEIHAMNEGATTILDHLISNGWLHQGIESFNDVNEEFDMNEIEMEQQETQATTILTSCSLSASNHLRAPTSCSCPSPSIMVTCTTDAPSTYHTNILDITDRITTLRTLIAEIQQVLSKSQNVMLEIQEHMEMFKDGVARGFHVERDSLADTLTEAAHQLLGYEKQYSQQIDIQSWICSSEDGSRSFQGRPGIIKASVTQLC